MISPKIDKLTGKLCAIVCEQVFGGASEPDEFVENLDDVLAFEPVSNFDGQSFACEDIDNWPDPIR